MYQSQSLRIIRVHLALIAFPLVLSPHHARLSFLSFHSYFSLHHGALFNERGPGRPGFFRRNVGDGGERRRVWLSRSQPGKVRRASSLSKSEDRGFFSTSSSEVAPGVRRSPLEARRQISYADGPAPANEEGAGRGSPRASYGQADVAWVSGTAVLPAREKLPSLATIRK